MRIPTIEAPQSTTSISTPYQSPAGPASGQETARSTQGLGQAIAGLGQEVTDVYKKEQDDNDAAVLESRLADYMDKAHRANLEFRNQEGENALSTKEKMQQGLEEERQKALANLPSTRLRAAFDRRSSLVSHQVSRDMESHESQQIQHLQKQSLKAVSDATDRGVALYAQDGMVLDPDSGSQNYITTYLGTSFKHQLDVEGVGPEERQARIAQRKSELHSIVMEGILTPKPGTGAPDVRLARQYLELHKADLGTRASAKFEHALRGYEEKAGVESRAAEIIERGHEEETPEDAEPADRADEPSALRQAVEESQPGTGRQAARDAWEKPVKSRWLDAEKARAAVEAIPHEDPAKQHIRAAVEHQIAQDEHAQRKAAASVAARANISYERGGHLLSAVDPADREYLLDERNGPEGVAYWQALEARAEAQLHRWRTEHNRERPKDDTEEQKSAQLALKVEMQSEEGRRKYLEVDPSVFRGLARKMGVGERGLKDVEEELVSIHKQATGGDPNATLGPDVDRAIIAAMENGMPKAFKGLRKSPRDPLRPSTFAKATTPLGQNVGEVYTAMQEELKDLRSQKRGVGEKARQEDYREAAAKAFAKVIAHPERKVNLPIVGSISLGTRDVETSRADAERAGVPYEEVAAPAAKPGAPSGDVDLTVPALAKPALPPVSQVSDIPMAQRQAVEAMFRDAAKRAPSPRELIDSYKLLAANGQLPASPTGLAEEKAALDALRSGGSMSPEQAEADRKERQAAFEKIQAEKLARGKKKWGDKASR